jgi:hypothetical protein
MWVSRHCGSDLELHVPYIIVTHYEVPELKVLPDYQVTHHTAKKATAKRQYEEAPTSVKNRYQTQSAPWSRAAKSPSPCAFSPEPPNPPSPTP